jgi:transcriptional regulator with XRE-family HTH domain
MLGFKKIDNTANYDDILVQFGKNLKTIRLEKKITQEKLALENNFDPTYISLLERGKRNPSLKTIYQLACFLDVQIADLVLMS